MATTVTNHPSALFSRGHWGPSLLPSPVPLPPQHRGSAPRWGSTTLAPSLTRMRLLSLKTQATDPLACTPTTHVPAAGVVAWGWREAPSPLTCEGIIGWQSKHYFIFHRLLWHWIKTSCWYFIRPILDELPFCNSSCCIMVVLVFYMTHIHSMDWQEQAFYITKLLWLVRSLHNQKVRKTQNNQRYLN